MLAAARAGLKDHRHILRLGGGDIGAHLLPAERDKPADGIAAFQRRLQHI